MSTGTIGNSSVDQVAELQDGSIDAGLALLLSMTPRGVTRSQQEIADACGCSRGLIYLIEKSAKEKLRRAFERRGLSEAIR